MAYPVFQVVASFSFVTATSYASSPQQWAASGGGRTARLIAAVGKPIARHGRADTSSSPTKSVARPAGIRYARIMAPNVDPALSLVLDGLMQRYQAHVPDVGAILAAMVRHGLIARPSDIENDHIAFRTLGVRPLGIASLERVFLHHGYERRDRYDFPGKKVNAHWYAPPAPAFPRIFISELRVHELSAEAQAIIRSYTSRVTTDPVDGLNLDSAEEVVAFLHAPLWRTPTWADYQRLQQESEFAAWVIYNRYYLNHFTVSIHNLPAGWNTLDAFNRFLESNGFTLNDSGGKAKVSADGKLLQSSTVAALVDAAFDDGRGGTDVRRIPGSYVEFAERRVLDAFAHLPASEVRREHRREGFEAASADKIFESTYTAQAARRQE
jgi:hypothetical protein